jgi:hypothetical protein
MTVASIVDKARDKDGLRCRRLGEKDEHDEKRTISGICQL